MALRSMAGLNEPHTLELPDQRMATIMAEGDVSELSQDIVPALYASVNEARRAHDFELEPLRARWSVDARLPQSERPAMWGLPIPADVTELPQPDSGHRVMIETWEYGSVAEVMHEGSRAEGGRAIDKLRRYIEEQGFEVIGPHEEEYLTSPGAPVPKTLIRYRVRVP